MARTRPRYDIDPWEDLLPRAVRLLPAYLVQRRWFGGKGRRIARVRVVDRADLRGAANTLLTIVEVVYADRGRDRYVAPLAFTYDEPPGPSPPIVRHGQITIHDAFEDERFCRSLLRAMDRAAEVPTSRGGVIRFVASSRRRRLPPDAPAVRSRLVATEQSNTSVIYDDALILKAFRRLQDGVNPEVEILRFLARHTAFNRVPPLAGWAEYEDATGSTATVAVLQGFVPNDGDGWSWTLRELNSLLDFWSREGPRVGLPERSEGLHAGAHRIGASREIHRSAQDDTPEVIDWLQRRAAAHFAGLAELGRVTAGLHLALATRPQPTHESNASRGVTSRGGPTVGGRSPMAVSPVDPAFAPRPIGPADIRAWQSGIAERLDTALERLRERLQQETGSVVSLGANVLAAEATLRARIGGLDGLLDGAVVKTRLHGDYHLGQVLRTRDSFVILDFEGEPLRPLAERRALHTPLKDVAGLLRSLNYARHAALRALAARREGQQEALLATWERLARRAFLDAYVGTARVARAPFLPRSDEALRRALAALELEKAAYELEYELDNRPDWLAIPLAALTESRS